MSSNLNLLLENGFLGKNLKSKYEKIEKLAREVTDFVEKHYELLNCHMVDVITEDYWKNLLNQELKNELDIILKEEDILKFKIGNLYKNDKFPNLSQLVEEINNLHVRNISSQMLLPEECKNRNIGDVQKMWISQKKHYETDLMANLIANIAKPCEIDVIVDFGCGKGYLPSLLALRHGLSVLGIDSSAINKNGAEKRNSNFRKEFLKRNRAENTDICDIKGHFVPFKENITMSTDIKNLVTDNMKIVNTDPTLLICGLHTCGNLGSDVVQHFVKTQNATVLCYVGCCYHFIEEKYYKNAKFDKNYDESEGSFPMSNLLTNLKCKLGRNARMLACQSFERTIIEDKSHTVFYRALLEVILKDHNVSKTIERQVGRISAKCANFQEYVYKAFDKLELSHLKEVVTNERIDQYLKENNTWMEKLYLFQQIRIIMGTVVETAIILDRLLYLIEQESISNCHLLQVFDPVKSPRCYCIIGIK